MCRKQRLSAGPLHATLALACMLAFIPGSRPALAQSCGPAPMSISYSQNYKDALSWLVKSDTSTGAQGSIPDIVSLGFDQHSTSSQSGSMTKDLAVKYIQQEIADRGAEIAAVCGYYACTMESNGNNTNSTLAALSVMSHVCPLAFGTSAPDMGNSTVPFTLSPSYIPIVFNGKPQLELTVTLINNDRGALTFSPPTGSNSYIRYDGGIFGFRNITVNPGESRTLKIRVSPPTESDSPSIGDLSIHLKGASSVGADVQLVLARSRDDLSAPASVQCGQINPHLRTDAESDQPWAPNYGTYDQLVLLRQGTQPAFASTGTGWPSNGGGAVTLSADASCNLLSSTRTAASTVVDFVFRNTSTAGHCCSGFNPGGKGHAEPQWSTSIYLPGDPLRHVWTVHLLPSLADATCKFSFDGIDENPAGDGSVSTTTAPGTHLVAASCTTVERGSYPPAGWNHQAMYTQETRFAVSASRSLRRSAVSGSQSPNR